MPRNNADRRPATNETAIQKQAGQPSESVPPRCGSLHVIADLIPPAGRRALAVAVVRCGLCGGRHLHRGRQLDGAVRTAGCCRERYILAVRHG
jgi:hypothetical protein